MSALRIAHPGSPTRVVNLDAEAELTRRQREVLHVVRAYNGNRSRAARHLGVRTTTVQMSLRAAAARGVPVPPAPNGGAGRGPDLRPRRRR